MHTICLKAISRDFFESVLPKPELSSDEDDFPVELVWVARWLSCFGGASFLMFTTLSTILLPISTGFTSPLPLAFALRMERVVLPFPLAVPFEVLPLAGELDCCLRFPLALAAPGLPRVAEAGLSGNVVLRLGGASSEKPGISEGFQGLDLTVGEAPREGA